MPFLILRDNLFRYLQNNSEPLEIDNLIIDRGIYPSERLFDEFVAPKRVVITGIGMVTSLGNDVATAWDNLVQGKSGASKITHFDSTLFKTQFACEVKNWDPTSCMDRRDVRKFDLHTQFGVAAAVEAINDSGLQFEQEDCNRIGVVYGEGAGDGKGYG